MKWINPLLIAICIATIIGIVAADTSVSPAEGAPMTLTSRTQQPSAAEQTQQREPSVPPVLQNRTPFSLTMAAGVASSSMQGAMRWNQMLQDGRAAAQAADSLGQRRPYRSKSGLSRATSQTGSSSKERKFGRRRKSIFEKSQGFENGGSVYPLPKQRSTRRPSASRRIETTNN